MRRYDERTKAELVEKLDALQGRISELEEAGEALLESEGKWRCLVENAPDIIMVADRDGTIRFINHTISGMAPDEVIGKSLYDYIQPEHHEVQRRSLERVFRTGESENYELTGIGPDRTTSWYRSCIGPIKRDGKVVAVIIITRDITRGKQVEETLEERWRFERLVSTISSKFVNIQASEIDKAIEKGLGLVGEFFDVDRVAVSRIIGGRGEAQTTHIWLSDKCDSKLDTCAYETTCPT